MRNRLTTLFFSILSTATFAQLSMSNQGSLISLKNGAFISVHGDYQSDKNGSFDNEDTVFLFGNWINNAGNTGFNQPHEGAVVLIGDNQRIQGTDITHYANLDLRATGIKYGDLDVIVEDTLQLNDREMNMDVNTVEVTNIDTGSVKRSSGFVSSLADGGIARHTAFSEKYLFPVGSSMGTLRYRPAEITPSTTSPHLFKVRLANVDATLESFDRGVRQPTICEVNPNFYHRIFRVSGSDPADIKLNYLDPQDGHYENMVHWQNIPQWEDIDPVSYLPGAASFSSVEVKDWNDYAYSPFALANTSKKFDINNDDDVICQGDTLFFNVEEAFINYEFFVNGELVQDSSSNVLVISTIGNGDSIIVIAQDTHCIAYSNALYLNVFPNPAPYAGEDTVVYTGASVQLNGSGGVEYFWSPDSSLSCASCPDPLATVFETTPYVLIATNQFSCKGTDTVVIYVNENLNPEEVLFIPNAITPNGDGVNEAWNIKNIDLYPDNEIIILNRWGDEIFRASPYIVSWDGKYNGTPVPDGTYYYLIKLNNIGKVLNGPLTVIR